jgi:hypothetical protein
MPRATTMTLMLMVRETDRQTDRHKDTQTRSQTVRHTIREKTDRTER